jgi:DNA (cytosine-5)-methyltransferase 1
VKILNLYAGIGGNRKLWGDEHEITAVEYVPEIAAIYQDFFPNDTVIIADAHQYLLDHWGEFDFVWSSPPCPTHSRIRTGNTLLPWKDNTTQLENGGGLKPAYPDMRLYQEIVFLKHFSKPGQNWVIENVISYYDPLIRPQEVNQHYFWSNQYIPGKKSTTRLHDAPQAEREAFKGFSLAKYKGVDKRKLLRNCVDPSTGLHVFNAVGLEKAVVAPGENLSLLES